MGEQKPSRFFARTWPLGLVLAVLLLCGRNCGRSRRSEPPAESPRPAIAQEQPAAERTAPPRCELHLGDSPVTPVFPTEGGLDEWFSANVRGLDNHSKMVILEANGGFIVDSGTPCSYVDRGFQKSLVRILSGPHEGKAGWIYSDWARK